MRKIVGIIGQGDIEGFSGIISFCVELGDELVSAGYRIVSGGLNGVMEAVSMGAMNSDGYFEGSIICITPHNSKLMANPYCDIVIPTGLGICRNSVIINTADILIAIGGGAGTLSELAFAWQKGKTVLCVTNFGGWAEILAGQKIDDRNGRQKLVTVNSVDEILNYLKTNENDLD